MSAATSWTTAIKQRQVALEYHRERCCNYLIATSLYRIWFLLDFCIRTQRTLIDQHFTFELDGIHTVIFLFGHSTTDHSSRLTHLYNSKDRHQINYLWFKWSQIKEILLQSRIFKRRSNETTLKSRRSRSNWFSVHVTRYLRKALHFNLPV